MHITEIAPSLKLFTATVKAHYGVNNTATLKTAIYAEGPSQARQLLSAVYGVNGVMSLMLDESNLKPQWGTQTLAADQLAKQSVKDAKTRTDATDDARRLQKKIVTAQHKAVKDAAKRFKDCQ